MNIITVFSKERVCIYKFTKVFPTAEVQAMFLRFNSYRTALGSVWDHWMPSGFAQGCSLINVQIRY